MGSNMSDNNTEQSKENSKESEKKEEQSQVQTNDASKSVVISDNSLEQRLLQIETQLRAVTTLLSTRTTENNTIKEDKWR